MSDLSYRATGLTPEECVCIQQAFPTLHCPVRCLLSQDMLIGICLSSFPKPHSVHLKALLKKSLNTHLPNSKANHCFGNAGSVPQTSEEAALADSPSVSCNKPGLQIKVIHSGLWHCAADPLKTVQSVSIGNTVLTSVSVSWLSQLWAFE